MANASHLNNPHFEQPPLAPTIPILYPDTHHIPQSNVPNYSPPPVTMPIPHPVMPQVPCYNALNSSPSFVPANPFPVIAQLDSLKTESTVVQCPHCHHFVWTVIDHEVGLLTGLSMAGLYMVGCHSGGCLLPYLFPWTKDIVHTCPACKSKVATFKRLERDTQVHTNYSNT
ncbi:hypothetical protein G6F37_006042 [Rhizopus arrhizus]|nr:hypothetical protein G6F38_004400 [Rhizopus arrhizus]KAG1158163.1 hypothetical protein G6F37_006042 [Rhizopus arrhizus]